MKKHLLAVALTAAFATTGLYAQTFGSFATDISPSWTSGSFGTLSKQWSYNHGTSTGTNFVTGSTFSGAALAGQTSEISAFDSTTGTLWVAGGAGVNVFDAKNGTFIRNIAAPGINSVAINNNGVAAFAIESTPGTSRSNPGVVQLYDTANVRSVLTPLNATSTITVGSLPDMLTFTPDGTKLLVANEATPNFISGAGGINDYGVRTSAAVQGASGVTKAATFATPTAVKDPAGSVSIIDVATKIVTTLGFAGLTLPANQNLRTATGMNLEPEYIAVSADGKKAFVGLQEANGMAVLNLETRSFTKIVGLGAKDFGSNPIDALNGTTGTPGVFVNQPSVKGLYMPDGMAAYQAAGKTFVVMANEGDFREDDSDRLNLATATSAAVPVLSSVPGLRVLADQVGVFAAGGRSFSIRDEDGKLIYDSGDILDQMANKLGIYDDGRSRDKGVEPEGVELITINGRVYAFIGLERTLKSAFAIFDITDPEKVSFLDMILDDQGRAPEGLKGFTIDGVNYLAISNEGNDTTPGFTTVFSISAIPEPQTYAMMLAGLGLMGAIARRRKSKQNA